MKVIKFLLMLLGVCFLIIIALNVMGKRADFKDIGKDIGSVDSLVAVLKDKLNFAKDKLSSAKSSATKTLGEVKDSRAVGPLIDALKDGGPSVRNKAAEALGEIKDTRAIEPLIGALNDKESQVREKAAEALKKITGQNIPPGTKEWEDWWEKNRAN
jgi:HEAT repeat protein